jgi:hypothetical protein
MSGISLALPDRWHLLHRVADVWHRWRFHRSRHVCKSCRVCRGTLEADWRRLIELGYYRESVLIRRIQLEQQLSAMVDRLLDEGCTTDKPRRRVAPGMIAYLKYHGVLNPKACSKINETYSRASRVLHGSTCNCDRAVSISDQVLEVLDLIGTASVVRDRAAFAADKIIVGFAKERLELAGAI